MNPNMTFEVGDQIGAVINAYYQIPKSCYRFHKKTNTTDLTAEGIKMLNNELRPIKKPDSDNLAKICLDALNGIAYPDDSQIVALTVNKYYSKEPRVEGGGRHSFCPLLMSVSEYTLIKLYYTKALSDPASSLAPD